MNFQDAIKYILLFEAGYANDPSDPGGPTNFGISARSYPDLDIENLSENDAINIYKSDYWDKTKCEWLPPALRLIVLDAAVNQGVKQAIIFLQKSLNIKADGIFGPITNQAISDVIDSDVLHRYWKLRLEHYHKNPNWNLYSKSWTKRLCETLYVGALFSTGKKSPIPIKPLN